MTRTSTSTQILSHTVQLHQVQKTKISICIVGFNKKKHNLELNLHHVGTLYHSIRCKSSEILIYKKISSIFFLMAGCHNNFTVQQTMSLYMRITLWDPRPADPIGWVTHTHTYTQQWHLLYRPAGMVLKYNIRESS